MAHMKIDKINKFLCCTPMYAAHQHCTMAHRRRRGGMTTPNAYKNNSEAIAADGIKSRKEKNDETIRFKCRNLNKISENQKTSEYLRENDTIGALSEQLRKKMGTEIEGKIK